MNRVRVAKDKADLVKAIATSPERDSAPFETYADAIAFAAALGANRKQRSPLQEISNREPAPIALEVFLSRGYDRLIKLLAVTATQDPKILSITDPACETQRLEIFEEYANAGLAILKEEFRGAVDYTERLMLVVLEGRSAAESSPEDFDLSRFLG
ncbi:MAG TPA: DNA phosphorothioation-associated protein 4 [Oscillatoriales cyanobacterium M4454_W2019_049]|nr:DNA phosphorothioation-associated protein 4 [Oscillatoriales cyanobacterium M4454_W2019_049]